MGVGLAEGLHELSRGLGVVAAVHHDRHATGHVAKPQVVEVEDARPDDVRIDVPALELPLDGQAAGTQAVRLGVGVGGGGVGAYPPVVHHALHAVHLAGMLGAPGDHVEHRRAEERGRQA